MRLHLQYTADDYEQGEDARGVSPMSNIDCEIVENLINILRDEGLDDISKLLKKWKDKSDKAVLKTITDYKDGIVNLGDSDVEGEAQELQIFIMIKENSFRVASIFNIATDEEYVDNRMHYNVIVNKGPIPAQYAWYVDTKIVCYSREEQKKLVEEIRQKLMKYKLCKFI